MKISIVTPSYNQGKFIEETILSIIDQRNVDLEYFVIDGGSTDNSVNIIKKYADRINYWVSEKDNGQSEAINKGWSQVSGDIIAYLNSDDCYTSGALKLVEDFFIKNPDVDIVVGKTIFIDENSQETQGFEFMDVSEVNDSVILDTCNIPQPSTFLRKRVVDKIGMFDIQLHYVFDYDYWVRAYLADFKFLFVKDVLSKFRLHNQSKTMTDYKKGKFDRDFLTVYEKHFSLRNNRKRKKRIVNAYLDALILLFIHLVECKIDQKRIKKEVWAKLIRVPSLLEYTKSYKLFFWLGMNIDLRKKLSSVFK